MTLQYHLENTRIHRLFQGSVALVLIILIGWIIVWWFTPADRTPPVPPEATDVRSVSACGSGSCAQYASYTTVQSAASLRQYYEAREFRCEIVVSPAYGPFHSSHFPIGSVRSTQKMGRFLWDSLQQSPEVLTRCIVYMQPITRQIEVSET
jgi:hypothetical protein